MEILPSLRTNVTVEIVYQTHPKYSPEEEVVNRKRLESPVHFLSNCYWLVLVVHSSRPNIIPFRDS